jgi:hypothetical protein
MMASIGRNFHRIRGSEGLEFIVILEIFQNKHAAQHHVWQLTTYCMGLLIRTLPHA